MATFKQQVSSNLERAWIPAHFTEQNHHTHLRLTIYAFEFSYYIQLNLILYTKLKSGAIEAVLSIHAFINAMGEKRGHNELLTTPKHITCFISLPKKDVWPGIIPKVVKYNLNIALEIRELEIFGEHSKQLQY